MDRQAVLDKVAKHLLTQNQKSQDYGWDQTPMCVYRNNAGLKCAIGGLILDEHYHASLEGHGCTHEDVQRAVELSIGCKLHGKDTDFLIALQQVHDWYLPEKWYTALVRLAGACGLKSNWTKE